MQNILSIAPNQKEREIFGKMSQNIARIVNAVLSLSRLIEGVTMKWMLWLLFSIGRNVVNFHKRPQVLSPMMSTLWGQRDLRIPSSFVDSSNQGIAACQHLRDLMMCSFWPCTRTKVQDTIKISNTAPFALDLAIKIWLPLCSLMQQLDWPDRSPGQGPLVLGPGVPCFVFFPQSWLQLRTT